MRAEDGGYIRKLSKTYKEQLRDFFTCSLSTYIQRDRWWIKLSELILCCFSQQLKSNESLSPYPWTTEGPVSLAQWKWLTQSRLTSNRARTPRQLLIPHYAFSRRQEKQRAASTSFITYTDDQAQGHCEWPKNPHEPSSRGDMLAKCRTLQ